ncbi:MAG: flagellar biosynthesis repressor FlbT [Mesorhizobium sp.]
MTNTLKLSLKPNEKIYINGAVVRVDRKVSIELMNDVQFLLESHVLQPEDASTPLKQLYFIVQVMLMNPQGAADARDMFRRSLPLLLASYHNEQIRSTLKHVDQLVGEDHVFEALKAIRSLYGLERKLVDPGAGDGASEDMAAQPLAVGAR